MKSQITKSIIIVMLFCLSLSVDAQEKNYAQEIETANQKYYKGQKEESNNDLRAILKKIEFDLKKYPQNAELYYHKFKIYFYLEDAQAAYDAINMAIKKNPGQANYHFMKGVLCKFLKKYEESKSAFVSALKLKPDTIQYKYELAFVLRKLDQVEEAIRLLNNILKQSPGHVESLFQLGVIYKSFQKDKQALKYFLNVVILDDTQANAFYNIGQIYQTQKKYEQAAEYFERAKELDEQDWQSVAKLVQLYTSLKDISKFEINYKLIKEMNKTGKIKSDKFCREQIHTKYGLIVVYEYFKLSGERAKKYVFHILKADNYSVNYTISLGSYESTNQISRETGNIKKDERLYHLDYYEKSMHSIYGFYKKEPSYQSIRETVLKLIKEKHEKK